jgi:catecholate siderophore receptor
VSTSIATSGKVRADGIELTLAGRITPRWEVSGGLTILDPKVVNSTNPADVGRTLANVPKKTFSLLTNYLITPKLKVGAQAYYASKNWGGRIGASSFAAPEYWRFDANASYEINEHVKLRLNVINLTDKTYYDAIYASGAPFSYIAPGRTILGSIAVMF